ncbi:MAG TPA: benzoate-CoA ligase family protein [Thermoanaerobaculia bacterium]|jgi:benzoate-CoA ligase family protein|nr:benzoate-CoA ligase family protein [Thermoanaerobaculia bacterium]
MQPDPAAPLYEPPEDLNLADYLLDARIREGLGDKEALRLDDRSLTYREVQALANRAAQAMARAGLQQEERVLLGLVDGPEFVACLFGALKLGAVVVMANPQLSEAELAGILAYSRARLAVVDASVLPTWEAAARGSHFVRRLLVAGELNPASPHARLADELAAADDRFENVATHRDDPAIWLFSGGTTGRPKAVVQTHRSYANTTECYAKRAVGYRADDVTMAVPSLYFGYATGSNLFFPFSVGATSVLFPEARTPEVVFAKAARHRPTILVNVPTMVARMVQHADEHPEVVASLANLRFATSAGEALPVSLYERWRATFGAELLDGLGTAEMWHIFLTNLPGEVRPGTLGRAVPGFEVRACDDEGRELPRGEVGRLWVRGGSRAIAYWQNLPQTLETFRGEWVALGDLVKVDDDGYVIYCGRADDVLKVGGKWCTPGEIESCLLQHPAVRECAVVGAEDEAGLTKPVAFVIAADDAPADLAAELKAFVLARLAAYKHPRRVIVTDSLPRTHLGKIDRGKLRALARA